MNKLIEEIIKPILEANGNIKKVVLKDSILDAS